MKKPTTRLDKAFSIVDHDRIFDVTDTHATVISNGSKYRLNHKINYCPCKDNRMNKMKCKHLIAVDIFRGTMKTVKVS
jgi:hypothetical protein